MALLKVLVIPRNPAVHLLALTGWSGLGSSCALWPPLFLILTTPPLLLTVVLLGAASGVCWTGSWASMPPQGRSVCTGGSISTPLFLLPGSGGDARRMFVDAIVWGN